MTNPSNGTVLSAYEISRADETPREVGLADRRWDCRNDDTE